MKRKIDSFLDEDEGIHSKRELARKIGEHPSMVYRVLQRCIEGDDVDPPTVVLIRGMGYCHKNHEASHRKRMSQLSTFRQVLREEGATTKKEDEIAFAVKRHVGKGAANIRFFTRNRVFRWLLQQSARGRSFLRGLDEHPERVSRSFLETFAERFAEGESRESLRRVWEIFDRWDRKPD